MKTLPNSEIVSILTKVKEISETHRNPDWKDNAERKKRGKICNRAAGPRDLGATKENQGMTKNMYEIEKMGYLKEIGGRPFPYFQLTDEGLKFLSVHEKSNKKKK